MLSTKATNLGYYSGCPVLFSGDVRSADEMVFPESLDPKEPRMIVMSSDEKADPGRASAAFCQKYQST